METHSGSENGFKGAKYVYLKHLKCLKLSIQDLKYQQLSVLLPVPLAFQYTNLKFVCDH